MGPVDKQKKDIQRDLKKQKLDVAKAKKIAENLMNRLVEAEGRLSQTEIALDNIPAQVMDNAMNAIQKRKDLSHVKSQLEALALRIQTQPAPGQGQFKIMRLPTTRGKAAPGTAIRGNGNGPTRRVTGRPPIIKTRTAPTKRPYQTVPRPVLPNARGGPIYPPSVPSAPPPPRPACAPRMSGPPSRITSVPPRSAVGVPPPPSLTRGHHSVPRAQPAKEPPDDEDKEENDNDDIQE